ncbi:unnamed protein product [Mytilus coruscus]|uniref:Uncharacterized protein n=1 Tax=Mytilus coruscus TaxID=42192 RepID=A0A6J8BN75_MYTCO|nr:unnamed protein product [Mytilus coruscus]
MQQCQERQKGTYNNDKKDSREYTTTPRKTEGNIQQRQERQKGAYNNAKKDRREYTTTPRKTEGNIQQCQERQKGTYNNANNDRSQTTKDNHLSLKRIHPSKLKQKKTPPPPPISRHYPNIFATVFQLLNTEKFLLQMTHQVCYNVYKNENQDMS